VPGRARRGVPGRPATIDRDFLRRGGLTRMLDEAAGQGLLRLTSPDERRGVRERLLSRRASADEDVWVFAYGSLMWNPAFHFAQTQPATVHGYHRRFCLNSPVGRGTPERPGLMLGLERGGSCRGIAFRIEAAKAPEELDVILARELVAHAYRAIWVRVRMAGEVRPAIAFAIDETLPTYAGRLPDEETARRIATASGALGHNADYLEDTVAHLDALGLRDRSLEAIRDRVRALRLR
jgi:cation transport protein ChaC